MNEVPDVAATAGTGKNAGLLAYIEEDDLQEMPGGQVFHEGSLAHVVWLRMTGEPKARPYVVFGDKNIVAMNDEEGLRAQGIRPVDPPEEDGIVPYRWTAGDIKNYIKGDSTEDPTTLYQDLSSVISARTSTSR